MKVQLITAPTSEPVSLSEARDHLRLPIPGNTASHANDNYILSLITVARQHIEEICSRAIMTQTWDMWLDNWPDNNEIVIPRPPLQSVDSLTYMDINSVSAALTEGTEFSVDTKSERGRIVLDYNETWPSVSLHPNNPIKIRFDAGYTTVPVGITQAIKLLVAHWDRTRTPVSDAGKADVVPLTVSALLAPYKLRNI